jgi:transcriptional regulator with XRE-family HTH domain
MSRRRSFDELRGPVAADDARRARVEELRAELLAGAAIQALREARGLSQTRLAELLGVSQPWVSRVEDQDDVLLSTLLRIVDALDANLELRVRSRDGVELVWHDGAWQSPDTAADPAA